jgi:mitochondrial fission protein ELM1
LANWITPEEMARKRELKKKIITFSLPFIAILIGALVTVAANGL